MGHTRLGSGEITINLAFSLSSESSSGGGVQQPYWEIKIYSTKSINEHQKRAQLRPKGFVGRGITGAKSGRMEEFARKRRGQGSF